MDYHQDRFEDHSLMIYSKKKLVALFPANRVGDVLHSHQGLSYGGLLLLKDSKFEITAGVFKALLQYLNQHHISALRLKLLPNIYHLLPSDEIEYLLFKTKAELYRRDVSMVFDMRMKQKMSSNRKRNLKKAISNEVTVREVDDFDLFFNTILVPNLEEKHKAMPTHSVEEITVLKSYFPKQIRQFNAYCNSEIIAGVTVFETDTVAHAQYISTIASKNELGGLDMIFNHLIHEVYASKRFLSFGISNENQGQHLNLGLLNWKESFGTNAIVHDFYSIETENYTLLDDMML